MIETYDQPIPMLPDVLDPALVLAVLNKDTQAGEDYSTEGNDLTVAGECIFGRNGSLTGDGSSSYMRKAVANFRNTDYEGTLEFWYKRAAYDAPQSGIFVSTDEAGANEIFAVYLTSNRISLVVKDSGLGVDNWRSITPTLPAGEWYHVVISSDGSSYYFYLHGVPASVTGHTGPNDGSWIGRVGDRDSVVIGADLSDSGTTAYLPDGDEVRGLNFYSGNKSADWVSQQFKRGVPDSSLVLHVTDGTKDHSRFRNTLVNTDVIVGKEMEFNGSSSRIVAASAVPAGPKTLSLWTCPEDLTSSQYVTSDQSSNIFSIVLGIENNYFNLFTYATGDQTESRILATVDAWQLIGYVWDGTRLQGYKNGDQIFDIVSTAGSFNDAITSYILGSTATPSAYFNGKIDELKLFSEGKTAGFMKKYYLETAHIYA